MLINFVFHRSCSVGFADVCCGWFRYAKENKIAKKIPVKSWESSISFFYLCSAEKIHHCGDGDFLRRCSSRSLITH